MIKSINQLDLNKTYTYADYLTWWFDERVELIKGKIFRMSPAPNTSHQRISAELTGVIWTFLKGKECNLFAAPFDVRLIKKKKDTDKDVTTVLQPDLIVVCDPKKIDERGCNGAPDLIIEILSPGNSAKEMRNKYDVYEENSVKEYWVVQPEYQNILVFELNSKGKFVGKKPFTETDVLQTKLFKGLKINVSEIFKK